MKNAIGILESSDHFSDIATVRISVLVIHEHAGSSCPPVPSVPFVVFYSSYAEGFHLLNCVYS